MKRITLSLLLTALLFSRALVVYSQTAESSYRGSIQANIKITDKLHWEIDPEYRFGNDFNTRSLLLQTGLNYRLTSWLNMGAYYRMQGEWLKDADNSDETSFEFSNRFAFDANTKFKLSRLTPKFRIRLCNFSDFDGQTDDKSNYLRYRFALSYDIKGLKINPFASVELFEKLSSGSFNKLRYTFGGEYLINKRNAIALSYSLDNKFKSDTRNNIFELCYKVKF